MAVERGCELGRQEVRPAGAGAVLAGTWELAGAEKASWGPAAPQQGPCGFGASLHPLVLGRGGAVQETNQASEKIPIHGEATK